VELGQLVTVFRRGSPAAAAKGSWRTGKLKAIQTKESWSLWANQKAIDSLEGLRNLRCKLNKVKLTPDGTTILDSQCPSIREILLGPAGAAYNLGGIVAATDGSLKKDGSMGAAFVTQNNQVPSRSVAVFGSKSSLRPELAGIVLALEDCPQDVDLNILTDSLSSLRLLKSLQRADFPLTLYRHPVRHLTTYVVLLINRRAEAGSRTRLFKVKSHRGEPLNEAADTLASAAAELDPVQPLALDPQAVCFYHCNQAVEWNTRLRQHLIERAAHQQAAKLLQSHSRSTEQNADAEAPPHPPKIPLTSSWLLRAGQGRRTLGKVLANMKMTADKRRVLQSIATFFPANAVLHRWRIIPSPSCSLCPSPCETQTHIQTVCPALQEMRIRAHHTLARILWDSLEQKQTPFNIHREITVDGLRGLPAPIDRLDDWQRCMDCLIDNDLELHAEAEDPSQQGGLRRKRPDAVAIHWGQATAYILEFTRPSDSRIDWHTRNDLYKRERYTPLMTKMRTHLTQEWTVEILCFTLGVRGSYHEEEWTRNLTSLGYPADDIPLLMTELVSAALTQLNELYKCRSSALQSHARQAHQ
jgi:ribonuclease HI